MAQNPCVINMKGLNADFQALLEQALETRNIQDFKVALANGANPNQPDSQQLSIFEKALKTKGCVQFVEECLRHACNPLNTNFELNKTYNHLTPLNSLAKNITNEDAEDVIKCIDLLLKCGASPNIPDQGEMTPILHVITNQQLSMDRKREVIQKLLSHPGINLDTFRDGEARILLKKEFPDFKLPKITSAEINFSSLLSLLRNGKEEQFLQSFSRYLNQLSTLQNAELLIEAIKRGLHQAFDIILKSVPDINLLVNGNSAIEIACIWGNSVALSKLLDRKDLTLRFQENLLIIVIRKWQEKSCWSFCDHKQCFNILLNSHIIDINETDASGSTALHYAVKYRNKQAIQELLRREVYLGSKNKFNNIPIDEMDPDILEDYFDSCITTNGYKPGDEDFEIIINYNSLIPSQPAEETSAQFTLRNEMTPITHMAESKEMRHLLKHPMITSFLFLKWQRLSVIFYINLLLYSLFCVSIVTHTILKFRESENKAAIGLFGVLSLIGIVYLIIRELLQVIISFWGYIKSPINYLEIILICLCIVTVTEQSYDEQTSKIVAVFTMLLLSVELCLLVGSLPVLSISTHILMLIAVLKSFVKCLAHYSILVFTFSLCFYILFGKNKSQCGVNSNFNNFSDPFTVLIKTIVMMTGEFDAGDMDFSSPYSYFLFILFVIVMSIVLVNLLNGVAVNDTCVIKEQAELNGLIWRVKLLNHYQPLLTGHRTSIIINYKPLLAIYQSLHNITGTTISISPNKIRIPIGKFLPCSWSCITDRTTEMDSRTVKMAIAVTERRREEKNINDNIEMMWKIVNTKRRRSRKKKTSIRLY